MKKWCQYLFYEPGTKHRARLPALGLPCRCGDVFSSGLNVSCVPPTPSAGCSATEVAGSEPDVGDGACGCAVGACAAVMQVSLH